MNAGALRAVGTPRASRLVIAASRFARYVMKPGSVRTRRDRAQHPRRPGLAEHREVAPRLRAGELQQPPLQPLQLRGHRRRELGRLPRLRGADGVVHDEGSGASSPAPPRLSAAAARRAEEEEEAITLAFALGRAMEGGGWEIWEEDARRC